MSQFMQWLGMGGYANYVWPAYGLVCVVLLINWYALKVQQVQTRKKLQHWFKRQQT